MVTELSYSCPKLLPRVVKSISRSPHFSLIYAPFDFSFNNTSRLIQTVFCLSFCLEKMRDWDWKAARVVPILRQKCNLIKVYSFVGNKRDLNKNIRHSSSNLAGWGNKFNILSELMVGETRYGLFAQLFRWVSTYCLVQSL